MVKVCFVLSWMLKFWLVFVKVKFNGHELVLKKQWFILVLVSAHILLGSPVYVPQLCGREILNVNSKLRSQTHPCQNDKYYTRPVERQETTCVPWEDHTEVICTGERTVLASALLQRPVILCGLLEVNDGHRKSTALQPPFWSAGLYSFALLWYFFQFWFSF